jgi:mRNA interferase MazF
MNDQSAGSRPCIVVQNDRGNEVSPLTQVVPLTDARQFKNLPVQVLLDAEELRMDGSKDSSAECGQVRTIDRTRVLRHRGEIAPASMARVDEALRRSLAI